MEEIRFDRDKPVVVRLDGRAFSSYTRKLKKTHASKSPFHDGFRDAMLATAAELMREFRPVFAYTQSDEISLVFCATSDVWNPPFSYRQMKMVSLIAAHATAHFLLQPGMNIPGRLPTFDARAFQVDSLELAREAILERMRDNNRNFFQMCARSVASFNQLIGKSVNEQKQLLDGAGFDYESQCEHYKFGTCIVYNGNYTAHSWSQQHLPGVETIFAGSWEESAKRPQMPACKADWWLDHTQNTEASVIKMTQNAIAIVRKIDPLMFLGVVENSRTVCVLLDRCLAIEVYSTHYVKLWLSSDSSRTLHISELGQEIARAVAP